MATEFAIEDALDLRYVSDHAWNDGGTALGYLRFDAGDTDVVVRTVDEVAGTDLDVPADEPDARTECGSVTEFGWRPGRADELAFVSDGRIDRLDGRSPSPDRSGDPDEPSSRCGCFGRADPSPRRSDRPAAVLAEPC